MLSSLRATARTILSRKLRTVSVASLLTIAVVTAACAVVMSFVDAILLRPLPYPHSEQLLSVELVKPQEYGRSAFGNNVPYPLYEEWQRAGRSIGEFAASSLSYPVIRGTSRVNTALALSISSGMLPLLGAQPSIGPGFPKDGSRENLVLLSDRYWARWFNRDAAVIGRWLEIDNVPFRVVGVMPPGFRVPFSIPETNKNDGEIWVPLEAPGRPAAAGVDVLVRAATGVMPRTAETVLDRITETNPGALGAVVRERSHMAAKTQAIPMKRLIAAQVRTFLLIVLGSVGCLLLLACVNVATLLSAATASRIDEFALRNALGASRARVVLQVLGETSLVICTGGAAGMLLAWQLVPLVVAAAGQRLPDVGVISVDWRVAVATFGLIAFVSLAVSIVPLIQATGAPPQSSLTGVRTVGRQRGRAVIADSLVAAQITLAMLLLAAVSAFLVSFRNLTSTKGGYDPRGVVAVSVTLDGPAYADERSQAAAERRITNALRRIPGVSAVAVGDGGPSLGGFRTGVIPEGESDYKPVNSFVWRTSGDYFNALGMHLLRGRTARAPSEATIDAAAGTAIFGMKDPIGRLLRIGNAKTPAVVVGIVSDLVDVTGGADASRRTRLIMPHVYTVVPEWSGRRLPILIRANHVTTQLIDAVRDTIVASEPNLPEPDPKLLTTVIRNRFGREYFLQLLGIAMAVVAFAVAIGGLYALMLRNTSDRMREFGLRLALGAQPASLAQSIVRRGVLNASAGLLTGLLLAHATFRFLQPFVFEMSAVDIRLLLGTAGAMFVVAFIASAGPALRALQADPATVLRES